ncbi:sensor domain-containing diguanylate cyclase [Pelomonas sp. SE-A7]|uniref:sensor domain-containing diguanylate cyclase n=1 Tax=Pelomonas sp. SE-A7 TaxID=3054953 RepID=UPI00259C86FC|nr:sensor domain-containing diguanylate cyclase [Pelomonas sp. SE-A7]MDM4764467.1 diguanylate cyclase [Pelomonas sp. SE-A7]
MHAIAGGRSLRPPGLGFALRLAGVALAYYLTARLGLLIPYIGSHVSLFWLPTGVAIAAYLRWGGAMASAVLLAAFAVNLQLGGPAWAAAGIALGNAGGPWLSARLLKHWEFDPALTRRRDLGVYLLAVLLGMLVTASNGTSWLHAAAAVPSGQGLATWMTWWTGDAVGALLGGIPLVAASGGALRQGFAGRAGRINLVLLLLAVFCAWIAFSPWTAPPPVLSFPLLALPLFLITLLALRSGVWTASVAVLLLSGTAAWGTAAGAGPFVGHDTHAGLLALWSYVTAQACTSVLICGLAAELLASKRQQQALFLHANEAILMVDPDGRVGAVNPAARKLLDLTTETAASLTLGELAHGNGLVLKRWLSEGAGQQQYLALRGAGGRAIDVEAQAARHLDARGRWQTQLMLRDVTERREAEARLASNEERLRAITDNAPALIADHDAETRYRFANRTYLDWLGIAPETIVGRTVRDVLGEQVWAEIGPHMEAAQRGESASYERHVRSLQGERWIHVNLVPRRGSDGSIGFYALASDITPRKRAEAALRQSERRLRSIADRLPMRISFIDAQQRYRFMNLAYEGSFGRSRDELLGLTVRELVGEAAYAQAEPYIQRALRGEAVFFDSEMTTREGYRCYRVSYLPQFAEDGAEVLGFVAMVQDTTAHKLEERRLFELSQSDPLTGLLNRAGFEQRLHEAMQRSRATGKPMALLLLDLDGFKQINDSLGHQAGDLLLCAFAGRLSRALRVGDAVARPGGDEFAVVLEGLAEAAHASHVAANIVQAMHAPFLLESRTVTITTSVGVAAYAGEQELDPRTLTRLADARLYAAKAAGRDRYCDD